MSTEIYNLTTVNYLSDDFCKKFDLKIFSFSKKVKTRVEGDESEPELQCVCTYSYTNVGSFAPLHVPLGDRLPSPYDVVTTTELSDYTRNKLELVLECEFCNYSTGYREYSYVVSYFLI